MNVSGLLALLGIILVIVGVCTLVGLIAIGNVGTLIVVGVILIVVSNFVGPGWIRR